MARQPLRSAVLPIFLLLGFLVPIPMALAASPDVETKITPAEISAGESFSLHIGLHGSLTQAEPDLTPLEAAFEILEVNQSQRRSYVNGAYDASSNWEVTLLPRTTGRIEVPALSVGSASTTAGSVLVSSGLRTSGPVARRASPVVPPQGTVAVRVSVERFDPYEQERVIVRVRLYAGENLIEGSLGEPEVTGATIERLGDDQSFEEEIQGVLYPGVERTYALLPETAGDLIVPSIGFEGLVRDDRPVRGRRGQGGFSRHSLLDDFFGGAGFGDEIFDRVLNRGRRRVVARSEPLILHVRPRPEASNGSWWLPASGLSLEEEWNPAPTTARVGEALTRRITLRAQGASALQLPPFALPEVSGVKQYAEAPQTTETGTGTIRVQEATVIPTQPGTLTLPAIEVAWWDTQADAARTASLPARSFEVFPAISGTVAANPPAIQPAPLSSVAAPNPTPLTKLVAEPESNPRSDTSDIWLVTALALAMLGVGTGVWVAAPRLAWRDGWNWRIGSPPRRSIRGAERALRTACCRSDPAGAELALREIGRIRDPNIQRMDIGHCALELGSKALHNEVARLRAVQYSSTHHEWKGEELWNAYRLARKQTRTKFQAKPRGGLPPLYPDARSDGGAHGVA